MQSSSHFRPLLAQAQFSQVPLLLHRHDIFTSHTFQSITGKKSLASQSDPTSEHHCYGLKTVQARIQDTEQTTKAKHKSNSITVDWQIDLCLAVFCLNCWDDHEDQPKRPDLPAISLWSGWFFAFKTGLFPIAMTRNVWVRYHDSASGPQNGRQHPHTQHQARIKILEISCGINLLP